MIVDQWGDPGKGGVDHIELARWAELLLIAPATANIIAKLAVGIADDALSTYALAHRAHDRGRAGDEHVDAAASDRAAEPRDAARARRRRHRSRRRHCWPAARKGRDECPTSRSSSSASSSTSRARDLEGRAILVTAGPTREPIDPVRYISNRSSGKMGYAIAEAAQPPRREGDARLRSDVARRSRRRRG